MPTAIYVILLFEFYVLCANTSSTSERNCNVLSVEIKTKIINTPEKGEIGSSLAMIFKPEKATVLDIKSKRDIILKFELKFDSEDELKKNKP